MRKRFFIGVGLQQRQPVTFESRGRVVGISSSVGVEWKGCWRNPNERNFYGCDLGCGRTKRKKEKWKHFSIDSSGGLKLLLHRLKSYWIILGYSLIFLRPKFKVISLLSIFRLCFLFVCVLSCLTSLLVLLHCYLVSTSAFVSIFLPSLFRLCWILFEWIMVLELRRPL